MINRLVIFGATGDLNARYLLPALAALRAAGHLDDRFELTCVDRADWTGEEFQRWAAEQLDRHDVSSPAEARQAITKPTRYLRADATDVADVASAIAGDEPVAVYLALPPAVFPGTVAALRDAGLVAGSRIVLEKPFGEDLDSAVALNRLLAEVVPEQAVFRVDHFLAMTTVQNVLGSRLANRVLEPIWNSAHIAEVEIVWDESLALEGRAGYYDGAGALKDMVQNHLLQVLCLVAMEPPLSLGERDLRDRKIGTETFAEVELELESWRWSGTTFRLRTGKALGHDRKEVAVRSRPVPHLPFGLGEEAVPNVLRFGLEPESMTLALTGIGAGAHTLAPLTLTAQPAPAGLPAYGRLLLDVLHGNAALSIRGDEAEEAWRVLTPVMSAWSRGLVPLAEYPAGSDGPAPARRS
jgi:glucose-6-phosphate 1-dehydrogenase